MSQIKTQRMGRILAAGSKEKIDEVLDTLAKLNAIHFIEYDGCLLYTSPSPRDA